MEVREPEICKTKLVELGDMVMMEIPQSQEMLSFDNDDNNE